MNRTTRYLTIGTAAACWIGAYPLSAQQANETAGPLPAVEKTGEKPTEIVAQPELRTPRGIRKTIRIGAIAFGASWGIGIAGSIFAAAIKDNCTDCGEVAKVLWVPFAGPILGDVVDISDSAEYTAAMVSWSAIQLCAAGLLIWGVVKRQAYWSEHRQKNDATAWFLVPTVGRSTGLSVGYLL